MKTPRYFQWIWLSVLLLAVPSAWVQAKEKKHGGAITNSQESVSALDFTFTTNNGTITITKYLGNGGGAVTIPGTIHGLLVTGIGNSAFYSCMSLTSIIMPTSITQIGDMAFRSCTSLSSVAIPTNVVSIGDSAFACCISMTGVTIPDSVTLIGDSAFAYCSSLTSVAIPPKVTRIECGTFQYCTHLVKVRIPNGITSIEDLAFAYCPRLASVTIPGSVTRVRDMAFRGCRSLRDVNFKGDAPILGSSVFASDTNATLYYSPGTTGWSSEFGGRPASGMTHIPSFIDCEIDVTFTSRSND